MNIRDALRLKELLRMQRKPQCERSFFQFFIDAWDIIEPDTELRISDYLKYQCDLAQKYVEQLIETKETDYNVIVVNVPPATSKSTLWTKILPVWIWIKAPHLRLGNTSHSSGLSGEHSRQSRLIIQSEWFQSNWGHLFQLEIDKNRLSEYGNNKGGYRKAFAVGHGVTGFHMDIAIVDDPIDVMQPNIKSTVIERANNHVNSFIGTRVHGITFVIMQRAAKGDTTDMLLENPKLKLLHVCLPIKVSNLVRPTRLKSIYNKNGYLDKRLESKDDFFRSMLTNSQYFAQYLQEPSESDSTIIKGAWWEVVSNKTIPNDCRKIVFIDGAYTKSTKNDPSGLLLAAYSPSKNKIYILDFISVWKDLPSMVDFIDDYYQSNSLVDVPCLIEPKASGLSLIQTINAQSKTVIASKIESSLVGSDKTARANFSAIRIRAKQVVVVDGAWNKAYLDEMNNFPTAPHDESIDLTAYAIDAFTTGASPLWYKGAINSLVGDTTNDIAETYILPSYIEQPDVIALVIKAESDGKNHIIRVIREHRADTPQELTDMLRAYQTPTIYGILEPKRTKDQAGRAHIFKGYAKRLQAKRLTKIKSLPTQHVRDFINSTIQGKQPIRIIIDETCRGLLTELKTATMSKGKKSKPSRYSDLLDDFMTLYFAKRIKQNIRF